MNKKILTGVAALLLLAAGIMIGLRLGSGRGGEPPAQGATETRGTAPAAADGYEEAIGEYFQAFERMDAEKYLSFMMLDFPGMPVISPYDKPEIQKQLETELRELGILQVEYSIRSAAPGSLSDIFHEEVAEWLAPQIEEVVRTEIDVRVRCITEALSDAVVVWLMKTKEGRWYIIEDSGKTII